ncbi:MULTISPECIES: D-ribose pyranase [unclassified Oceanispirochaeta]|uniref:D-ribose pyranase n=1 Tax=unclassified Oceanispirochaeta TaxID=2635722 RepID=UPI000E08E426|nr:MULTISPECIES: D-ribose pyranase [unclassified Oceanispirochaeta]MBF9014879.1 D-ribose pyranase [Oceanispirochaeta sp. M2]NPD71440.1 D-ribose pyranase [Oceanispirochaeta sp. M1]RDG33401.1 D-ribose pyranase [Oceanispirochaeta sp. M1]
MKKSLLLNSEISSVIAGMGHTDSLTIADAGLPVPDSAKRIDLAVSKGIPSFKDVLAAVLDELCIEKVVFAEEIRNANPEGLDEIQDMLVQYESNTGFKPAMAFIPHEEFKKLTADSKAVVRTGEVQPYANIILYSGVTF